MDFGLITDPRKRVPFNWRDVPSMQNHAPRNDRGKDKDDAARLREEKQQADNTTASVTGGKRNPDRPAGKGKGK